MSTTGSPGTPASVADDFVIALQGGDLDGAFGAVSPAAEIIIHPTGQRGGPEIAREFFREALTSFPDLMLTVTRRTACGNGRVLIELRLEGTQAADFLGAINQEKHLDLEQAWLFTISDGAIAALTGYWDQNKLYRRLAVKRLDRIAIA